MSNNYKISITVITLCFVPRVECLDLHGTPHVMITVMWQEYASKGATFLTGYYIQFTNTTVLWGKTRHTKKVARRAFEQGHTLQQSCTTVARLSRQSHDWPWRTQQPLAQGRWSLFFHSPAVDTMARVMYIVETNGGVSTDDTSNAEWTGYELSCQVGRH